MFRPSRVLCGLAVHCHSVGYAGVRISAGVFFSESCPWLNVRESEESKFDENRRAGRMLNPFSDKSEGKSTYLRREGKAPAITAAEGIYSYNLS